MTYVTSVTGAVTGTINRFRKLLLVSFSIRTTLGPHSDHSFSELLHLQLPEGDDKDQGDPARNANFAKEVTRALSERQTESQKGRRSGGKQSRSERKWDMETQTRLWFVDSVLKCL